MLFRKGSQRQAALTDHTRRTWLRAAGAAGVIGLMGGEARAARPAVSGPLPDPIRQGLQVWDPTDEGYFAEEYLLSGHADVYEPVSMADAPDLATRNNVADQARQAHYTRRVVQHAAPYTTRLIVYRPREAARASGLAIVEPVHPAGGGYTVVWAAVNAFFMQHGEVYVAVQHPTTFAAMRALEPQRYGTLHAAHPSQLWGMLADAGRWLKGGGLPGPAPRRLYMTGYSFTGVATSTFANYHHEQARQPDGRALFDGYAPFANAMYVRALDVPVLRMNTESDFNSFGGLEHRGHDSDTPGSQYRLYELAGASHVTTPWPQAQAAHPPRAVAVPEGRGLPSFSATRCAQQFPPGSRANDFPTRLMQVAVLQNLYDCVDGGRPPPAGALIETDAAGQVRRDAHGNALGGIRLTPIAVPVARYGVGSGFECFLFGFTLPFSAEQKRQLYGNHADYVERARASAQQLVTQRLILPPGREELVRWVQASETF